MHTHTHTLNQKIQEIAVCLILAIRGKTEVKDLLIILISIAISITEVAKKMVLTKMFVQFICVHIALPTKLTHWMSAI